MINNGSEIVGLLNFRDLGGLSTKDGGSVKVRLVYRSALLSNLAKDAGAALQSQFNISNVIDLRSNAEVEGSPLDWVQNSFVTYAKYPFSDGFMHLPESYSKLELDDLIWRRYFAYLDYARADIKNALENISLAASSGVGTVYACVFGKDRTGVLTAILLEILGVQRNAIVEDYLLSQNSMKDLIELLHSDPLHGPKLQSNPKEIYTAREQIISKFLEELDKLGGAEAWALSIGVNKATIQMLRKSLIVSKIDQGENPVLDSRKLGK